jgi:hypothetical protein
VYIVSACSKKARKMNSREKVQKGILPKSQREKVFFQWSDVFFPQVTSTHQHKMINTTRLHINTSTHQHIDTMSSTQSSAQQHSNTSALEHFNTSTQSSTHQPIEPELQESGIRSGIATEQFGECSGRESPEALGESCRKFVKCGFWSLFGARPGRNVF